MAIHKGSELNNVRETWQQNEQSGEGSNVERTSNDTTDLPNELKQTIAAEAAEYDNANKEDRLLDGDRASVNDDEAEGGSGA